MSDASRKVIYTQLIKALGLPSLRKGLGFGSKQRAGDNTLISMPTGFGSLAVRHRDRSRSRRSGA